jgi:hypothetical protein
VFSVINLRQEITYSFNAVLLGAFGGLLQRALAQTIFPQMSSNTSGGYRSLFPMGKPFITLALLLYAGLYGRDETELYLTRRLLDIQMR